MAQSTDFYINGAWVAPTTPVLFDVINPATEEAYTQISLGSASDVDAAVAAAKAAFDGWGQTTPAERQAILEKLIEVYEKRSAEMADAISKEMGAPITLATNAQAAAGYGHLKNFVRAMKSFVWERMMNPERPGDYLVYEPIGVAGLITPWNWPMNQVTLKVGAAIAAGCTMVLKPSEIAPMSSLLFAEFMDEAGVPKGVFNLVNGDGPTVGEAMSRHRDIDIMSLTGSARAGIAVSKASADTIKRVALELGGKGPNIVFSDVDVEKAVKRGTIHVFNNSGQSCNAPTRMLVQRSIYEHAVEVAAAQAQKTQIGDPTEEGRHIGPVVSRAQFDKIQGLIQTGIDEGARLVAGGVGRPEGVNRGYYVRPTVFADVTNDMTIAREEIFGPVLSMLPFEDEEEAIQISNDTAYGLASYLQTDDPVKANRVAKRLRAGMVHINGASQQGGSPFGGYKQSGNGREGGAMGIHEFLEVKTISGWNQDV